MAATGRLRGRRRVLKEVERELEPFTIEEEVSHLTRVRSEPCPGTRAAIHGARRKRDLSAFEMLSSRESGHSGGGGFCSADRAYAAGKHLPAEGPWCVEDMDSEAYVSQFSSNGSLLVAGFRGSRIRVYDVDKGWKVHKNISYRSMRWTVSDIALSPGQRYLVLLRLTVSWSAGKGTYISLSSESQKICQGTDSTGMTVSVSQRESCFSYELPLEGSEACGASLVPNTYELPISL